VIDWKEIDRATLHAAGNLVLILALAAGYWFFAVKLQRVEASRDEARSLLDFRGSLRPGSEEWDRERREWLSRQ
jgi:hypothetical protein